MLSKYLETSIFRYHLFFRKKRWACSTALWVPFPFLVAYEWYIKLRSKIGSNICIRAWCTTRSRKGATEIVLSFGSKMVKYRYAPGWYVWFLNSSCNKNSSLSRLKAKEKASAVFVDRMARLQPRYRFSKEIKSSHREPTRRTIFSIRQASYPLRLFPVIHARIVALKYTSC